MKEKILIGYYTVPEDTTRINNGFECAAWYEEIAIKAGKYPIMSSGYAYHERDRRYLPELADRSISIEIPGTVVSDDFGARFCGVPVGGYDSKQNAGKPSRIILSPYAHALAWDVLKGRTKNVELLPRFEARRIEFEHNGETHETAGIFDTEKERATA